MARLALLSVSDKTGLVELARELVETYQFQLISSGGTARILKEVGIPTVSVTDYTGAPEMLGGRVKTLHPRIHGGILAQLDLPSDLADLEAQAILPISLVVVNLYPFEATIAKPTVTLAEATEQIDIGGPTLVRAAAKNYTHVTVLTDSSQYSLFLQQLAQNPQPSLEFRFACAQQAFSRILAYDQAIADYLNPASTRFELAGTAHQPLRYGENPHQAAAWYRAGSELTGWSAAQQLQGKELSYNNLIDLEAARAIAAEFAGQAAAVVVKHTNPCGVAVRDSLEAAYRSAIAADPVSAFGGIVALTQPLDLATAQVLTETFLECVVAPGCSEEASAALQAKKNLRVLILPDWTVGPAQSIRMIAGGFLVQQMDPDPVKSSQWQVVTQRQPTSVEWAELEFAWKVCKHVKSNAIVLSRDLQTVGIGAGQMNRVGSVRIALEAAGEKATGSVLASDGFFPFDDSVRTAAAAGIRAIIQPGGSLRDQDSIQAADELGIAMILTQVRHFYH